MKFTAIACFLVSVFSTKLVGEIPDPSKLKITQWAANGMTKDPVALAFDHSGRLYIVESARRSSVDIDIRSHKSWLLEDLANDDFESMRAFFRSSMAAELSDENKSWLQDRNGDGVHDYRDLTTVSERIRLLEDTDQDGKADKSIIYADGFNEEFTGVAAGVMPYEGDVLFTVYPDLWRLRDLDGDGKADGRVSMFRGFGVHAAFDGHDLHGLTVGPEGKIYFSCGDNGFSVVTREGKRLHHPNTGGVLRMNPDGSDLEVFATGLRNVQEFDFDQYGNMFGVDNDGDLEDERERAVYIAEGSDSGWRLNWQFRAPGWAPYNGGLTYNPWTAEGMWKPQHSEQPAYITPPMQNYSVGPGGFKFNPGTALNDDYRDFFFCVEFPVQKITAFRTRPKGAGFEMIDEHLFHGGLMVSSLNFGPDGGIYLADWIGKWAPNEEGIIYRVDDPTVESSGLRQEVKRLINEGVVDQTFKSLTELLGHDDRRIRQLAQFELVRRKRGYRLFQVATDTEAKQLARIHALWGLLQLKDEKQMRWLAARLPWNDSDPQIRQQTARVAGDLGLKRAEPQLIVLLQDDVPLVQSQAAIALGKVGSGASTSALLELVRRNADLDPFIRHAAVMGLTGSADSSELALCLSHESDAVRLGAVLSLKRQKSPLITEFLQDASVRVRREAVRGVHDDFSIPEALAAVAELLDDEALPPDEPTLRRVISANLRVGDQDSAQRLARYVLNPPSLGPLTTVPLQVEALQCLAAWEQTPLVDRVEGRIRTSKRSSPAAGREALAQQLDAIFALSIPELSTEATRIAATLDLPVSTQLMTQWVLSDRQAVATRVGALRALHQRKAEGLARLLDQILSGDWTGDLALRKAAFEVLVDLDPHGAFARINLAAPLEVRRFFISQLASIGTQAADALLAELVEDQAEDQGPDDIMLDVIAAARARKSSHFADQLKVIEDQMATHRFGEYQFSSQPGDADRGETIYRNHVTAQCVRCHDAGGKGKQAGPELKGIAGRVEKEYLLEALVDPSAKIANGFESVTLLLADGRLLSGTVVDEDAERIVLGTPQAETVIVDKSSVDELSEQSLSAMPTMIGVLTPIQIRDVVAYLSTLK